MTNTFFKFTDEICYLFLNLTKVYIAISLYKSHMPRAPHALVPHVPHALRTLGPHMPHALCALVPNVLHALDTHVSRPLMPYMPLVPGALCSSCQNHLSCFCFSMLHVNFSYLSPTRVVFC